MGNKKFICPICNKEYIGYPALSRVDNKTEICSNCGIRQALQHTNLSEVDIENLIQKINKEYYNG